MREPKLDRMLSSCSDIGGVYSLSYEEAIILTNDSSKNEHGGIPKGAWLLAAATTQIDDSDSGAFKLNDDEIVLLRVRAVAPLPNERDLVAGRMGVVRDSHATRTDYNDTVDVYTRGQHEMQAYVCDVMGVFYPDELVDETGETISFGAELDNVWASARYRVYMPSAKALSWVASFPLDDNQITLGTVRFSATRRNAIRHGTNDAQVRVNIEDFIGSKSAIFGLTRSGKNSPLSSSIPVPVSDRFPTGWATVGELREEDSVYAGDGSITKVIGLSPIENKQIHRLHLADGRSVDCGPEHEWETVVGGPSSTDPLLERQMTLEKARSFYDDAQIPADDGVWASIPVLAALAGVSEMVAHDVVESTSRLSSFNDDKTGELIYPARESLYRIAGTRIYGHCRRIREASELRSTIESGFGTVTIPKTGFTGRNDQPDTSPVEIVDITVHETVPMRCISVAHPSGMYLTDDFVPTHNSNTIKTLVTSVYAHAGRSKEKIGQILFDPQGEYAQVNKQDGTGLRLLGDNSAVRIYTATPDPKSNQEHALRLNFFDTDQFDIAWSLISDAMNDPKGPVYVRALAVCEFEAPEENDHSAKNHHDRAVMGVYGLLSRAGYKGKFSGEKTKLSVSMKDDLAAHYNAANEGFEVEKGGRGGSWLVSSPLIAEKVVAHIHQLAETVKRAENSKKDEEIEERDLYAGWIESWLDPKGQFSEVRDVFKWKGGSGMTILKELRDFHSDRADGDLNDKVWKDMVAGRIVVIDLSIGSEKVTKAISERLIDHLVDQASSRFRSNLDPIPFQVVVEEAHNLFERGRDARTDPWVRMSKEAAKYRIGLMYATQEVTSVDQRILSNTHNWVVAHLNSENEIRELAKYYNFGDYGASIKRAEDRGYVRLKTASSPYIVPMQVLKFDHAQVNAARAIHGFPEIEFDR